MPWVCFFGVCEVRALWLCGIKQFCGIAGGLEPIEARRRVDGKALRWLDVGAARIRPMWIREGRVGEKVIEYHVHR